MSLSYTHLLICGSPDFRPDPNSAIEYVRSIHDGGFIGTDAKITFFVVQKRETKKREMTNPFTGETTLVTLPSRMQLEKFAIDESSSIATLATQHDEYSISLNSNQNPPIPPLIVGCDGAGGWIPFDENYNLEIVIQIRNQPVRLAQLDSKEQLDAPFDPTNLRSPIFDEDCNAGDSSGVFVHPQLGAYTLPQGGSASFWIEFRYGKFIYPREVDGSANVLCSEMKMLTQRIFNSTFFEASHWG